MRSAEFQLLTLLCGGMFAVGALFALLAAVRVAKMADEATEAAMKRMAASTVRIYQTEKK